MPETLNLGGRFTISGYPGVAWHLLGFDTEWTQEDWQYDGEGDPDDDASYWYCEPEEIEDRSRVRAVMVGDDREFVFDVEDLTEITEDDFCPGCGQIGCTAYGSGE